jgi:four helix bundle protein
MRIKRFEDLECWKEARKLVNMIYDVINKSDKFTRDYKLRGQVIGAALSVMSNIAEGFSRQSNREFIQFLFISKASSSEIQSILHIALDQRYISKDVFEEVYNQAEKVSKMNSAFIKYLKKSIKK